MHITGPLITKTVTLEQPDPAAYWRLNYLGEESEEGTFWYARCVYPSVRDAQNQHCLVTDSFDARRRSLSLRRIK